MQELYINDDEAQRLIKMIKQTIERHTRELQYGDQGFLKISGLGGE